MPIAATYVSTTSFTATTDASGSKDLTSQCAVGTRIRANCGTDGYKYGVVVAVSYSDPTTTVTITGDALTANLASFEHGNDTPASLANHGHTGIADGGGLAMSALTAVIASIPGHYSRDQVWAAKTVSVAADRYTLLSPNRLAVDVGGVLLWLTTQQSLVLSSASAWDSQATDYTVAANRAGKDFYVYACLYGSVALKFLISANSTYPTGYSASTSRKLGGFHCLCAAVGTISGHALTGYVAGDILPASVWDLKFRPVCAPEGMVYVSGIGKWVDIYLASVSSGALASIYGATCADGASTTVFDWYDFTEWFGRIGKRLPTQGEFMAAATGSNEGTNITGSADPGTTGGKVDTVSRRMISNVGCEDCCGNLWQWLYDAGGLYNTSTSFVDQHTSRTSQRGQGYYVPNRGLAGGFWAIGAYCGSRSSAWNNEPLALNSAIGARGVTDAIIS